MQIFLLSNKKNLCRELIVGLPETKRRGLRKADFKHLKGAFLGELMDFSGVGTKKEGAFAPSFPRIWR